MIQIPIDQVFFVAGAVVIGLPLIWAGFWPLVAIKDTKNMVGKTVLAVIAWVIFGAGIFLATNIITGNADLLATIVIAGLITFAGTKVTYPAREEEKENEQVQPVQELSGPPV